MCRKHLAWGQACCWGLMNASCFQCHGCHYYYQQQILNVIQIQRIVIQERWFPLLLFLDSLPCCFCFRLQSFKHFRVQYEMKRKQTEHLLQPLHRDGKLSLDQALVKQSWDRVSSRVSSPTINFIRAYLIQSRRLSTIFLFSNVIRSSCLCLGWEGLLVGQSLLPCQVFL